MAAGLTGKGDFDSQSTIPLPAANVKATALKLDV
jgi:hypothetical protein